MTSAVLPLAIFTGIGLLFWVLIIRPINKERALRKKPFTRDLIRTPGEGCLEKMEDLTDKLDTYLFLIIFSPGLLVGYLLGIQQKGTSSPHAAIITVGILVLPALIASVYGMMRVRAVIRDRMNYRLGFLGECHTAQAISPLAADGYRIYHDLQCRKPGTSESFNIDHVLLGPAGVVAIETKTRSKPANIKGRAEVAFDGQVLDYRNHRDAHGIRQALANAHSIADLIAKRTGTRIPVIPILCLPGWWVIAKTLEPLFVGNPEQVPARVRALPPFSIDLKTRNQIAALFAELFAAKID